MDATLHLAAEPSRRALSVAAGAAAALGLLPFHLPLTRLTAEVERDGFFRLWQRDRLALRGALLISFEEPPGEFQLSAICRLIGEGMGPLFLVGAAGQSIAERAPGAVIRMSLPKTDAGEVADRLVATLDQEATPALREIAARFRLPLPTLESCATVARTTAEEAGAPASQEAILGEMLPLLRDQVREAMRRPCRSGTRADDDGQPHPARRHPRHDWADRRPAAQPGARDGGMGFASAGGGAQGMSVLFAGPSGTGKTMAAEALAHTLSLDLFRVDLSRIVDKYIGETEKRLAALFDAADMTDAILLFDEADVLFGRRTEVKDSHDHYANLEVGYLLQRIEAFRGIAVLTTNLANAIDDAFARRFAFSLHFEFPRSTSASASGAAPSRRERRPAARLGRARPADAHRRPDPSRLDQCGHACLGGGYRHFDGSASPARSSEYAGQRRRVASRA